MRGGISFDAGKTMARASTFRAREDRQTRAAHALAFSHHGVAQHAGVRDLALHEVAVLHVLGGAVGAHPQHIARMEGEVLTHAADELAHPEDRILDGVGEHLLAVEPNDDAEGVRVEAGDDPWPHGLEGIRVLAPPERAIAALPGALADVVAYGVAEDIVQRLGFRDALAWLADHHHQLAFVLDLIGGVARN